MNRRAALHYIIGVPLVAGTRLHAVTKLGFIDIDRHLAYRNEGLWTHVFLDGRELTNCCVEADDEKGYAVLLKMNDKGKPYLDTPTHVAQEVRYGRVDFIQVPLRPEHGS